MEKGRYTYESRPRVEITSEFKGFYHACAVSHVRQDTQLKLSIVRHDQLIARFRNKRLSYLVDILIPRRLVLKVRPSA